MLDARASSREGKTGRSPGLRLKSEGPLPDLRSRLPDRPPGSSAQDPPPWGALPAGAFAASLQYAWCHHQPGLHVAGPAASGATSARRESSFHAHIPPGLGLVSRLNVFESLLASTAPNGPTLPRNSETSSSSPIPCRRHQNRCRTKIVPDRWGLAGCRARDPRGKTVQGDPSPAGFPALPSQGSKGRPCGDRQLQIRGMAAGSAPPKYIGGDDQTRPTRPRLLFSSDIGDLFPLR